MPFVDSLDEAEKLLRNFGHLRPPFVQKHQQAAVPRFSAHALSDVQELPVDDVVGPESASAIRMQARIFEDGGDAWQLWQFEPKGQITCISTGGFGDHCSSVKYMH